MIFFRFEKLEVWKQSRAFVKDIYHFANTFPNYELYALGDQLRRAAISIPSNIAEGTSRSSLKEQIHFIEIAYSSLMETVNQLYIAHDLSYINTDILEDLLNQSQKIAAMLSSLRTSCQSRINPEQ